MFKSFAGSSLKNMIDEDLFMIDKPKKPSCLQMFMQGFSSTLIMGQRMTRPMPMHGVPMDGPGPGMEGPEM